MKSDEMMAKQVETSYQNFPLLALVSMLLTVLFSSVMAYRVDPLIVSAWFGFAMLTMLLRWFFYQHYRIQVKLENAPTRVYRYLQLGVVLAGLVWGSAALFYLLIDDVPLRIFTVAIVLVAVLSGMLWHVAAPRVSGIYGGLCVLALALIMLANRDQIHLTPGVGAVFLIVLFFLMIHCSVTLLMKYCVQSAHARDLAIRLDESQRELEETEQLAHIGHWQWDYVLQRSSFSAEAKRILALPTGTNPSLDELSTLIVDSNGVSITVLVMQAVLDQSGAFFLEHRIGVGHGAGLAYTRVRVIYGADHALLRFIAVTQDVSELSTYREQLHLLANTDSLTGLPNRTSLYESILKGMAETTWSQELMGLMVLGLDGLKAINETFGHTVGDQLLRELASRLVACVRHYDTVARLGTDEFAILLPKISDCTDLDNIARKLITVTAEPFCLENSEFFVTCNIGIACFKNDGSDGGDLLRFADAAMSHAKETGVNSFQFYAAELTMHTAERLAIHGQLRKAITHGEFELYFQPQINLDFTRLTGVEALLRWNHPEHGLVLPENFISVAEETGLIVPIGAWVLRSGCQMARHLNQDREGTVIKVAVNLSPRQFYMNDLVGTIRKVLEETSCQPAWLECEITERLLLDDSEGIRTMLQEIRGLGVSLSIDDFGTGYSSLSYLNRYPVNAIKIDRAFVKNIVSNQEAAELVKAIISMASCLHLEVVAEGVESYEQEEFLKMHGCHIGQGWLYGKAMAQAHFEEEMSGFLLSRNSLASDS